MKAKKHSKSSRRTADKTWQPGDRGRRLLSTFPKYARAVVRYNAGMYVQHPEVGKEWERRSNQFGRLGSAISNQPTRTHSDVVDKALVVVQDAADCGEWDEYPQAAALAVCKWVLERAGIPLDAITDAHPAYNDPEAEEFRRVEGPKEEAAYAARLAEGTRHRDRTEARLNSKPRDPVREPEKTLIPVFSVAQIAEAYGGEEKLAKALGLSAKREETNSIWPMMHGAGVPPYLALKLYLGLEARGYRMMPSVVWSKYRSWKPFIQR